MNTSLWIQQPFQAAVPWCVYAHVRVRERPCHKRNTSSVTCVDSGSGKGKEQKLQSWRSNARKNLSAILAKASVALQEALARIDLGAGTVGSH